MLIKCVALTKVRGRGRQIFQPGEPLVLPPGAFEVNALAGRVRKWDEGDEAQEQVRLKASAEELRKRKIAEARAVLAQAGLTEADLQDAFDPEEPEAEEGHAVEEPEADAVEEPEADDVEAESFFVPSKPLNHHKNEELEDILDTWGVEHDGMDRGEMLDAVKDLMAP
jgi:hypothetical protein